jgi:hypothetical protein
MRDTKDRSLEKLGKVMKNASQDEQSCVLSLGSVESESHILSGSQLILISGVSHR